MIDAATILRGTFSAAAAAFVCLVDFLTGRAALRKEVADLRGRIEELERVPPPPPPRSCTRCNVGTARTELTERAPLCNACAQAAFARYREIDLYKYRCESLERRLSSEDNVHMRARRAAERERDAEREKAAVSHTEVLFARSETTRLLAQIEELSRERRAALDELDLLRRKLKNEAEARRAAAVAVGHLR